MERYGAASGVVLTGIGGIGKTALAGRVISRLRDEGWLIAVHEGRWNPAALIDAVAQAIAGSPRYAGSPGLPGTWRCWPIPRSMTSPSSRWSPGCCATTGS